MFALEKFRWFLMRILYTHHTSTLSSWFEKLLTLRWIYNQNNYSTSQNAKLIVEEAKI